MLLMAALRRRVVQRVVGLAGTQLKRTNTNTNTNFKTQANADTVKGNGRFKDPTPVPIDETGFQYLDKISPEPEKPDPYKLLEAELKPYVDTGTLNQLPEDLLKQIEEARTIAEEVKRIAAIDAAQEAVPPFTHSQVRRVKTQEEIAKAKQTVPVDPEPSKPNYEAFGYGAKQERVNIDYNYNLEEYRDFTKVLKGRQEKDEKRQLEERKLLKYLKTVDDHDTNLYLKQKDMNRLMIPEDPEPLDLSDIPRKLARRKRHTQSEKYDNDISHYDVWRSYDRALIKLMAEEPCTFKFQVAPALLVKVSTGGMQSRPSASR